MNVTAVVPTLGRSPHLVPCLEALRREGAAVVLVDQGEMPVQIPDGLADRILRPGRNLGFAAGTNLGIAEATSEWIATVNDDAVVEPGWLAALVAALEADPGVAAVQGVNLQLEAPELVDGCGIAWNRWWQAVQVDHGRPAPPVAASVREIFGVSATAALYRRAALEGEAFDPRLGSYYEDVDLAVRLRAAGWRALLVPAARARHGGSTTGRTLSRERWRLIYGNRYLVVSRLLGRGFLPRLPALAARDGIDLGRALLRGDREMAAGIVGGWGRALRGLRGPR
ncbi:MAG TPA: glycosyltransferase [Thermoanaerobaculia bacterium]|nr:glycosyltransferase [Thermoanaerobaculia bacterium]